MAGRELLGSADVTDEQLAAMVAASLGSGHAQVISSQAEEFPYDLQALTTAGRFWVRGTALLDGTVEAPFAFFVKVVQSWARSSLFQLVPEHLREAALRMVPWRTEPDVYRSDLADRLPQGLAMPRARAVIDLDDDSAALWLEPVTIREVAWDTARHERAAYLLGRLAASAAVAPIATGSDRAGRTARDYAAGRLAHLVLPALRSEELWSHPLVADAFDDELRSRMLAAAESVPALLDELDGLPLGTVHGDACTRNLLLTDGHDGFTVIDFGFWGRLQLGHDLGQLLLGEVQMGERPAIELVELEAACLPAYVRGLRAEGCDAPEPRVRRSQALLMLLFSGLSAIPFEHLPQEPTPELHRVAHERAACARFVLDLVAATAPATVERT